MNGAKCLWRNIPRIVTGWVVMRMWFRLLMLTMRLSLTQQIIWRILTRQPWSSPGIWTYRSIPWRTWWKWRKQTFCFLLLVWTRTAAGNRQTPSTFTSSMTWLVSRPIRAVCSMTSTKSRWFLIWMMKLSPAHSPGKQWSISCSGSSRSQSPDSEGSRKDSCVGTGSLWTLSILLMRRTMRIWEILRLHLPRTCRRRFWRS